MCSRENGVPTCSSEIQRSYTPSSLNLKTVAKIYGTDGFKNPNNYVKYKDSFAERGSTDRSYEVNPPTNPPQTRTTFPNGCSTDNAKYDHTVRNLIVNPNAYTFYTICNLGIVQYSFSATHEGTGFKLHVLPPDTNVRDYLSKRGGDRYICEDPNKEWSSKQFTQK